MMKKMLMTWPKIDSLIWLACTKAKMLQKIVLLKIWNCFKISRIWRNSHLSDMHFSQKLQWVLLLQDCFNIQNVIPCSWQKILLLTRVILKSFQKKKEDSSLCHALLWSYFFDLVMLCYTLPCFSWHTLHQRQEFWALQFIPHVLGTKNEIYYSPVTIHCHYSPSLFIRYYSWHCLLRIFSYLRGVVPYV